MTMIAADRTGTLSFMFATDQSVALALLYFE